MDRRPCQDAGRDGARDRPKHRGDAGHPQKLGRAEAVIPAPEGTGPADTPTPGACLLAGMEEVSVVHIPSGVAL